LNKSNIYSVIAGDPYGDTFFEKYDMAFAEADVLFDRFKVKQGYPHEGRTAYPERLWITFIKIIIF
jgi:hypothetical protein